MQHLLFCALFTESCSTAVSRAAGASGAAGPGFGAYSRALLLRLSHKIRELLRARRWQACQGARLTVQHCTALVSTFFFCSLVQCDSAWPAGGVRGSAANIRRLHDPVPRPGCLPPACRRTLQHARTPAGRPAPATPHATHRGSPRERPRHPAGATSYLSLIHI